MKQEEPTPDYSMSQAELAQLGDKGVSLITRDTAVLSAYGINEEFQNNLIAKTEDYKNIATVEETDGEISDATQTKNDNGEIVKTQVRNIMVRVKSKFGAESGKYRMFGTKGMDEKNDADLVKLGKRVSRMSTKFLSQLADKGLTEDIIEDLDEAILAFDNSIDAREQADEAGDIATHDRIELGNELYALIIELFGYGKTYWVDKNEAKYNDYVIYESSAGALAQLSGEVAGGEQVAPLLTDEDVEITDENRLTLISNDISTADAVLLIYFALNSTDGPEGYVITTLAAGAKLTKTLAEMGYVSGTNDKLVVKNSGTTIGHFIIKVYAPA